jgi:hypothetical protein
MSIASAPHPPIREVVRVRPPAAQVGPELVQQEDAEVAVADDGAVELEAVGGAQLHELRGRVGRAAAVGGLLGRGRGGRLGLEGWV